MAKLTIEAQEIELCTSYQSSEVKVELNHLDWSFIREIPKDELFKEIDFKEYLDSKDPDVVIDYIREVARVNAKKRIENFKPFESEKQIRAFCDHSLYSSMKVAKIPEFKMIEWWNWAKGESELIKIALRKIVLKKPSIFHSNEEAEKLIDEAISSCCVESYLTEKELQKMIKGKQ